MRAHESKKPVSEKMDTMTIMPKRSISVSMSIQEMTVGRSGRWTKREQRSSYGADRGDVLL